MARIYLTRHSQTLFNVQYRTQGQCDSPLTEKGIEMAKNLGNYLRANNISFDHAYCSTSERTEDTLNFITNNKVEYTRLKGLKELNFGIQEGGSDKELWGDGNYVSVEQLDSHLEKYGAEKIGNLFKRMKESMDLIANSEYQNVLVVSHGLSITAWFYAQGEEFAKELFKLKGDNSPFLGNCDVVVIDYDGKEFTIVEYINHLDIENKE